GNQLTILIDCDRVIPCRLAPSLAKKVCDPIPCHTEQPGTDLFHRLHQTVRFHELVEDLLQNVLCIARVCHPFPDEVPQPWLFSLNRFGEPSVSLRGHSARPLYAQQPLHLPL